MARGEIFVEFVSLGNTVKVTAIDAATGTEASIIGPTGAPQATLKAAVLQKLNYVLKKRGGA